MNKSDRINLRFIIIASVAIIVVVVLSFVLAVRGDKHTDVSVSTSFPVQNPRASNFTIGAASAISVWISSDGTQEKILFEKNPDEVLLIASLTKLMTANIVLEHENLSAEIPISASAATKGGSFKAGEVFPAKTLLYAALIDSDNVAAYALSEKIDTSTFVALMNEKAKALGLTNTYYANAVGSGLENHSTADDLVTLSKWIIKNQPSIFAISTVPEFNVYNPGGRLLYRIKNLDPLLTDSSISWTSQIIGSKGGKNPSAGQCLLLVLRSPNNDGYMINVILKSNDRYAEMENLVNWIYASYRWN